MYRVRMEPLAINVQKIVIEVVKIEYVRNKMELVLVVITNGMGKNVKTIAHLIV